ncbi:tetraspanin-1 [Menidia menidia]
MGCFSFVKLMVVVFNLLIFLSGVALLAMGIWVTADRSTFLRYLGLFSDQPLKYVNVGYLIVVLAGVLVLLGLTGLCGAQKESKCLLLVFFSIVLIISVAEVAAGAVALAYSSFAERILRAWAVPALQNHYGTDPDVSDLWNATMTQMSCCGFSNYTDFLGSRFEEQSGGSLPASCCHANASLCMAAEAGRRPVQGCLQGILEILTVHVFIVGGIAAGVGVLEVTAMTLSMYMYCHLKNRAT